MRRYHTSELPLGLVKAGMRVVMEIGSVSYKGTVEHVPIMGGALMFYYTATKLCGGSWEYSSKEYSSKPFKEGPYSIRTFNYITLGNRKIGKFIP